MKISICLIIAYWTYFSFPAAAIGLYSKRMGLNVPGQDKEQCE